MATRPNRPCTTSGCPNLQPCPVHHRAYDRKRPSAARRGYGAEWQAYSKAYLEEHPWCVAPGCREPSSQTAAIVLDTFLGGGTTLMAAEQLDRRCFGMELDPRYCDVIVRRWEEFTGQKAVRLNDGQANS